MFDLISYIGEFLCYHSGVSFKSEILLSVLQEGCERSFMKIQSFWGARLVVRAVAMVWKSYNV